MQHIVKRFQQPLQKMCATSVNPKLLEIKLDWTFVLIREMLAFVSCSQLGNLQQLRIMTATIVIIIIVITTTATIVIIICLAR